MTLTEQQKQAIEKEYTEWENIQYNGKDKKERQKLGQFFTPPVLTIKMIEKFDSIANKDILDPTCGAGGLLAACILAGADPKRVYGIELDEEIAAICKKRLAKLGVPESNIKIGNALDPENYEFDPPEQNNNIVYIDLIKTEDKCLNMKFDIISNKTNKTQSKTVEIYNKKANNVNLSKLHILFKTLYAKGYQFKSRIDPDKLNNILNRLFKTETNFLEVTRYYT